jgi:protein-tyrosine phosphatase
MVRPAVSRSPSSLPRHVALDGQANFRDLGGYETTDGRRIARGRVYRSGHLAMLSDADVSRLEDLGIRTIVNLLTGDDIERYGPGRVPAGAREVSLDIDSDLPRRATAALHSGDFSSVPPGLNPEIHRCLIEDGRPQYAELLRLAADRGRHPLVFHCSHGVHRAGTGAAILLSALGVPWETVRADYLLSNEYRAAEVEGRLVGLRELAARAQGIDPAQVDMTSIEAFMIQDGSYIDASRDAMVDRYGSIEGYLADGVGLDGTELGALREALLE